MKIDINKLIFSKRILEKNQQLYKEKIAPFLEFKEYNKQPYFVFLNEELYWKLYRLYKPQLQYTVTYEHKTIDGIIPYSKWLMETTKIDENISDLKGIYGLYLDDEQLLYIGNTQKSFKTRFCQHLAAMETNTQNQYLYQWLNEHNISKERLTIKPLFILKEADSISTYGIECIEYAFISYFKPICNIAGRTSAFQFSAADWGKTTQEQNEFKTYLKSQIDKSITDYFNSLNSY